MQFYYLLLVTQRKQNPFLFQFVATNVIMKLSLIPMLTFVVLLIEVSKMNRILNEISNDKGEIIKYLEPTTLKKKVDDGAEKLGITPYEKLSKKDDDFIML